MANILLNTQCPNEDTTPSMTTLPHKITDSDLQNGEYRFDKMMRLHHPEDFKGDHDKQSQEFANSRFAHIGAIQETMIIDLSQNFDIHASIEYEHDQALYAIRLDELSRENPDDRDDLTIVRSHMQAPLEFIKNDDKLRTVHRDLVADDVDSRGSEAVHMLSFRNLQPEMISTPVDALKGIFGDRTDVCLFTRVVIHIKAVGASKSEMYSTRSRNSGRAMLAAVSPEHSPIFIHGRQRTLTFDLVFTHKPHLKGSRKETPLMSMRHVFLV